MLNQPIPTCDPAPCEGRDWKKIVAEHQQPRLGVACWQMVNSLGAYLGLWVLMAHTVSVSWWLTLPLTVLAAGLLVRVFIIFHDCGHGSFFKSRRANDIWGCVTGLLIFVPYHHWRWAHATHHATNADLDRRGIGDVWTMTVDEYLQSSRWRRSLYHLVRNPIVLFGIAPTIHFLISERFILPQAKPRERKSVWLTNLTIVALSALMIQMFGPTWVVLQLLVIAMAGSAGIWLFYVQHQFEDVVWLRGDEWDFKEAALKGSSYYKLPKVLQWFTGNIGFHHIHHLSSRVPNYNLEKCHLSDPMFEEAHTLTFWQSLKSINCRLWDEKNMKLITFRQLRQQLNGGELR